MSNITNSQLSASISTPLIFKEEQNVSLTEETLCIVGTANKGPAFVPQQVTSFDRNNDVLNTWENVFGNFEDQTTQIGPISARVWFESGKIQSSYIRVLGTPNTDNVGFVSGDLVLSGSITDYVKGESKFTNSGGDEGKVHFLTTMVENIDTTNHVSPYSDYIGQLGITLGAGDDSIGVITDVIMTSHGVSMYIQNDEKDNVNIISQKKELSTKLNSDPAFLGSNITTLKKPMIYVQGLKDSSKNVIQMYYSDKENQSFETDTLNKDLEWILNKGHYVYSRFRNLQCFSKEIEENENKYLLTTSNNSWNSGQVNYENFKSSFKKARTPWIVSQPLNRKDISDVDKTQISSNFMKLFRFFTYDDGEAGNRFRFRIKPRRKGDINSVNLKEKWSKFNIELFEFRNNVFTKIEEFVDLTLNPTDDNYICKIIGTEREFFNFDTNKLEVKGDYRKTNNYIYVEVHDDVEDGIINTDLIPCGFMPYPRLNIDETNLNKPATFSNKIIQNPLSFVGNHLFLNKEGDKIYFGDRYWGVLFDDVLNKEFKDINISGYVRDIKFDTYKSYNDSHHQKFLDYSKFFRNDYTNKINNVWIEDLEDNETDLYNSFFHLEKILYSYREDEIKSMWNYSFYQRDGRAISNIGNINNLMYKYVNVDELLSSDTLGDSYHAKFLSFDLMTYGGFDGFNILDDYKRNNHSISILREYDEEIVGEKTGQIYDAYNKASDIIIDDENILCDVFCMPGISHISLLRKIAEKSNSKQFTYVADVPEVVYNNNLENGNYSNVDSYLKDPILYKNTNNRPDEYVDERDDLQYMTSQGSDKTVDDFVSLYLYSEYSLFMLNSVDASIDNVERLMLPPSVLAINAIASTEIQTPLDSEDILTPDFVSYNTVLNKHYIYNNNKFDSLLERTKKHDVSINPVGILTTDRSLRLLSSNTLVKDNKSIMRLYHNVRIRQTIIRDLTDILTRQPIVQNHSILFSNNSKNSILFNSKVQISLALENYLSRLIEDEVIKNYSVYVDIADLDKSSETNYLNNIVHGQISISLFDAGPDNFINLNINNLINNIKQFTNQNEVDIINNTI
tara:strand:- start:252 stop:3476 length:3225 start_codon:yes stop_codon:yes gene_type:complete